MPDSSAGAVTPVDRFFEFSLLGLLASGFLSLIGTGYLDTPTVVIMAVALLFRALIAGGLTSFRFPAPLIAALTLLYFGFYPLDYFYISKSLVPSTIHLVFFIAVIKVLTGTTDRDYLYLKAIAFLELLAACVLLSNFNFFLFLTLFLTLAVATFASSEIRRSARKQPRVARVSARGLGFRLGGVSLFVSFAILAITAGLFFFLPRTARAAFQHWSHRRLLAGFSNYVTLGQIGEIKRESTPVMHVKMDRVEDRPLALKWRGAALSQFNGRTWFNRPGQPGEAMHPDASGLLWLVDPAHRGLKERHISYAVHLNEIAADSLFFAGTPEFVRIEAPVVRYPWDNYRLGGADFRGVTYQVYSPLEPASPDAIDDALAPLTPAQQNAYLKLPETDPRIPAMTRRIVEFAPNPMAQARAVERYLRTRYAYTLELPSFEPPDPIAYFLFDRRKGHCEYFASAMAVMLRTIGIPSRLVTGFQSGVYNPISGWQLIRASDAHSWVEAYLPYRGWTTFDPTPPDPNPPTATLFTQVGFYLDAAETFWQDWVVNYNLDRQLQLAARMTDSGRHAPLDWFMDVGGAFNSLIARFIAFANRDGMLILPFLVLALLIRQFGPDSWRWWNARQRVLKAQRGEAQASDATLLYARMLKTLKRRGVEKPPWLTPIEFSRVLTEPDVSLLVYDLTEAYNDLRFGGNAEAAARMIELLGRLETLSA